MINLNGVAGIVSKQETKLQSSPPKKPPTPPINAPEPSPIIDHFPLDKNLAYLMVNKFLLTHLPKVSDDRKQFLLDFLYKERTIRLVGATETIAVKMSIAELIKFSQGENKLVGGFVKYILGSGWFLALAQILRLPDTSSTYFKKILSEFDRDDIDIDFQHINPNVISPDILYIKLIQFFASRSLPKGASESDKDKVARDLSNGTSFKIKNPFVSFENGTIVGNVIRIPLTFEGTNSIDFTVGTICKKAYVISNQDFFLSLDNLDKNRDFIPQGEILNGWKAGVDCLCKTIQIEKIDLMSWLRTMFFSTQMGRHPFKIPAGVYQSLDDRCLNKGKVEALTFLATEILKHRSSPNALLALTYNICADLQRKDFPLDDLKSFCQRMLREEKYTGLQKTLQQALMSMPFDVVASSIELISILKMSSRSSSGQYLTQHDALPCIMTFLGDNTCIQFINPISALKRLQEYAFSREGLEILNQLFIDFEITGDLKRDFESAIDKYQPLLKWDWEQITLQTLLLFNKSKELNTLAHKLYCLCTGSAYIPQGKQLDLFLHLMRTWNPLDRLNGTRLWSLYTQSLTQKERIGLAKDVLGQSVHPKLTLYIINTLIYTSTDVESLKQLFDHSLGCEVDRTIEDLMAFFKCLSVFKKISLPAFQRFIERMICSGVKDPLQTLFLAVNEKLLPKEDEHTRALWLTLLQLTCEKKEYNKALSLWKQGDDLDIWIFPNFQKSHRRFVIEFIEHLYSQHDPDCNTAGHNLLEKLETVKDKLSARHTQLLATRDSKLPDLKESIAKLNVRISSFEKAVKDSNRSQQEELRAIAVSLFDDLAIKHPVHRFNVENLESIKRLLSNPKVISLFTPQEFQIHLTRGIQRFDRLYRSNKTEYHAIGSLLEVYFKTCAELELPEVLLDIVITFIKRQNHNGLRPEIISNCDAILKQLKKHNKILEICHLLLWYMNEAKTAPDVELSLWVLRKAFETENRSTCLTAALDYFSDFADKHPIPLTYEPSLQLQLYSKIIDYHLDKNFQQVLPWVGRVLSLVLKSDASHDTELDKKILSWCKHCSDENLVASFLEFISNSKEELNDLVWATTHELRDAVILKKPELYMRLFKRVDLKKVSDCTVARIGQVIKVALGSKECSEQTLETALSCYDVENFFYDLPFNSILRRACEINNTSLKAQALSIQVLRVSLLFKVAGMRENHAKMEDWTHSLTFMFKLIDQLKSLDHPLDYDRINMTLTELLFLGEMKIVNGENTQEYVSSSDSPLKYTWHNYRFKEIPDILKQLFRVYFDLLPKLENYPHKYLATLSGFSEAIENHSTFIKDSKDDLTIELTKTLVKSSLADGYYEGLSNLENLFKQDNLVPRFNELTDIFALYLEKLEVFLNNNKIVSLMNSVVFTIGLKMNSELIVRLQPAIIKIYPKYPYPGRLLLPLEILKDLQGWYSVEHFLKRAFLENPYGWLTLFVIYSMIRGRKVDGHDVMFLVFSGILYYTFIYPRYSKKPLFPQSSQPVLESAKLSNTKKTVRLLDIDPISD